MKADDIILGIPEFTEPIGDKEVTIRQMAAGPSIRFAAEVTKFQLEIQKMQPVFARIMEITNDATETGYNELIGLAQQADEFDHKKIPIVKKIIGEHDEQWIIDNITISPLLGLIEKQVYLNSLGLQAKNAESLPR